MIEACDAAGVGLIDRVSPPLRGGELACGRNHPLAAARRPALLLGVVLAAGAAGRHSHARPRDGRRRALRHGDLLRQRGPVPLSRGADRGARVPGLGRRRAVPAGRRDDHGHHALSWRPRRPVHGQPGGGRCRLAPHRGHRRHPAIEPALGTGASSDTISPSAAETEETTFPRRNQFAPELVHFSDCLLNGLNPGIRPGLEGLADVRDPRGLDPRRAHGHAHHTRAVQSGPSPGPLGRDAEAAGARAADRASSLTEPLSGRARRMGRPSARERDSEERRRAREARLRGAPSRHSPTGESAGPHVNSFRGSKRKYCRN